MTMAPLLPPPPAYFFKDSQNKYSFELHLTYPNPKIIETEDRLIFFQRQSK